MKHHPSKPFARLVTAVLCAASTLTAVACYTLVSATTVMSSAPTWTGTGVRSLSSTYLGGRSLGLAGQDVYAFGSSTYVQTAPFLSQFGGPYTLTSYTQTSALGLHEVEFIHGNLAGRRDNLRLLYKSHPGNPATWVHPGWTTFWDGGEYMDIVEVCELAASTSREYVAPNAADSHLYISFRACGRTSRVCAGGVLEAFVNQPATSWRVRSNQEGVQVTVRTPDGGRYPNECLPVSVTSDRNQARQYLVVGSPSRDELAMFDAFRLWDGPLSRVRAPDSTRAVRDVVVVGRREGSSDLTFVAVLSGGSGGTILRHHFALNGSVTSSHFRSETLASNVRFIESAGQMPLWDEGELYTYGAQVVRRRYARTE